LSGQHEDVIIVRKGGKIECIDTIDLGFPIGLAPNIHEFVSQLTIDLNIGDTVVFYTDGITEAENTVGKLYGIDQLCQVLSQNWSKPAREIQAAVTTDVYEHIGTQTIHDDMTLLVFKVNS
jgi:sigma-B regulation protein RsbU (phosphoserine phosphatase)